MTGAKVSTGSTRGNFSGETTAMLLSQPSGEISAGLCLKPCCIASPASTALPRRTQSEVCRRFCGERWHRGRRADEGKRCVGESSCQALQKLRFGMFLGVNVRATGPFVSQSKSGLECSAM